MSGAMITLQRVSHRYPDGGMALQAVDLTLHQGEMAFLTGASGARKSTLLKLLARLERASAGTVQVAGIDLGRLQGARVARFRQRIGIVFQNFSLLSDRRVFDNVALPLVIRGMDRRDIARRVRAALDAVDLLGRERSWPLALSGGEQQRVAIARAIVAKPELLLADEPTGNLDPQLSTEVMQLFRRFNAIGTTVLVATHALDLVRAFGCREIALENGRLAGDGLPAGEPGR